MGKITTTEFILAVLGSGSVGSLLMAWLNRRKNSAETEAVLVSTYGKMLEDLRKQMLYQGEQITNLQKKEVEYLKIISNSQKTERELRNKVREQDDQLKKQGARIKELEEKLNT